MSYTYNRTAAKKPIADKKKAGPKEPSSRTDGTKKSEVAKAISTIENAIDAVLDCDPNARDYQTEGAYDSKAYSRAVSKHNETIDALHDILDYLQSLEPIAQDG